MTKLMNRLLLSCFKATELIEKRLHIKLSWKESLRLRVHTLMCDACSLYDKQSKLLEEGVSKQIRKAGQDIDVEALKTQIIRKINQLNP